jgi:regulator of protease activity HflC (stomatin/prohibitin superfamily)
VTRSTTQLRGVLDEATGKWGIRVNRVELKAIDPPKSVQEAMEKQMRADRDKRAVILNAEGVRQSQILTAEGQKQAAILSAEGQKAAAILGAEAEKQSAILRADGESQAIQTVFHAIHRGNPDQKLLSYQYLQMLPKIAEGDANKLWVLPSEIGKALEGLGNLAGNLQASSGGLADVGELPEDIRHQQELAQRAADAASAEAESVAAAEIEAARLAEPPSGR